MYFSSRSRLVICYKLFCVDSKVDSKADGGVPPKSPDHQDVNTLRILAQTHQEACSPTMSGDVWHYRLPRETSASSFAPPQRFDTGAG